uniref:Uncharacterized protein n=1 Tax=Prolemur simus TaxID=1328070 RepID=A0A8C8ZX51_PROSS
MDTHPWVTVTVFFLDSGPWQAFPQILSFLLESSPGPSVPESCINLGALGRLTASLGLEHPIVLRHL